MLIHSAWRKTTFMSSYMSRKKYLSLKIQNDTKESIILGLRFRLGYITKESVTSFI